MSEAVRAALIGVGGYGSVLLRASRDVEGFDIVRAYYYKPERLKEVEARLGLPTTADFDEILQDRTIDALVIATPNDLHLPQARAGLESGKAVFVDKPITNRVDEALELIRTERETGGLLMIGHNFRRMPALRACERAIRDGAIGQVVSVEGNFSRDGAYEVTTTSWRRAERCPTGPLIQLGIHLIDVMIHYCGRPLEVAGFLEKIYEPGLNVDNTAALIRFEDKRLGTIQSNYLGPFRAQLTVYGTEGVLASDSLSTTLIRKNGKAELLYRSDSSFDAERDHSLREQFHEFAALVRNGGRPETDSYSALLALAVVNGVEISARERRFVSLSELIPETS